MRNKNTDQFKRYLVFAVFYLLINTSSLAASLKDFSANYDVYQNGFYLGTSNRTLKTRGNDLTFTSVTQSGGLAALFVDVKIVETSLLKRINNALHFHYYKYDEKQKSKHDVIELKISKTDQVYNSYNKQYYPKTQNLYDGLGFSIAMMQDLKNGQRDLNYIIAEKENLKTYQLRFLGYEKLKAYNNDINTLKMEYSEPESKARFTFWCAENMDFLPVRIQNIKKNGDKIILNLTEFNGKKIYLNMED